MNDAARKPRVLSGIAATGALHIGNYIGALSVWAREQGSYQNYFMIADLHALTIPENVRPDELRARLREIVGLYVACGLDPERCAIFRQSDVSAHPTLGWVLGCLTPVGWLERMTQYKAKSATVSASAGLFTYPALQAADILLYQAQYVPVGDDQRQHIEITRDIAQRFHHLFGEVFTLPEPLIRTSGARVMGLDDPTIKMSKSLAGSRPGHAIGLLDPPEKIRTSVMRAVTDSGSEVNPEHLSPGVDNLLTLFETLTATSRDETLAKFTGQATEHSSARSPKRRSKPLPRSNADTRSSATRTPHSTRSSLTAPSRPAASRTAPSARRCMRSGCVSASSWPGAAGYADPCPPQQAAHVCQLPERVSQDVITQRLLGDCPSGEQQGVRSVTQCSGQPRDQSARVGITCRAARSGALLEQQLPERCGRASGDSGALCDRTRRRRDLQSCSIEVAEIVHVRH